MCKDDKNQYNKRHYKPIRFIQNTKQIDMSLQLRRSTHFYVMGASVSQVVLSVLYSEFPGRALVACGTTVRYIITGMNI
jgi:hypothetical protein